ncbi:hypothetical protein C0993_011102 [Termitomyces sp. T159_Od127]|nr:hypothetical protein C0993_011102 [Termitomyces sp. T159_Od127]
MAYNGRLTQGIMEPNSLADLDYTTCRYPLPTIEYLSEEIYEDDYMNDDTESIEKQSSPSPPGKITYNAKEHDDIYAYDSFTIKMPYQVQVQAEPRVSLPISLSCSSSSTISPEYHQALWKEDRSHYLAIEPKAMEVDLHQRHKDLTLPKIVQTSNPRNTHGIVLRPVSTLPDIYRSIFKFGVFNAVQSSCSELTGDTVHFGKGVWGDAKKASIITLEVVVSRMRTRGSSVRFLFVSATVPNIQDIAAWIGSNSQSNAPAKVFEFGEEFRPCKLTRFVIGVPRFKGQNDFAFSKSLDYKLFMALQQYSVGKPIMIFCSTRKGVFATAEQLMKDYLEAEKGRQSLPWSHTKRSDHSFNDKRLADLASVGIGVHHAGLTLDDRKATETLYLNGTLRVIVATSVCLIVFDSTLFRIEFGLFKTLAVGVNLPAHMVVIKGVQTFNKNTSVEYSDLDVIQMMGRAGRPQFDKDGIALIICETELEQKYKALVQGKTVLESTLHTNLAEHLNSEIGLGTITSISTAKAWLRSSFLFQRLQKNPAHYSLGKDDKQTWEERVDELVLQSVEKLRQTQLVENGPRGDELISTDFGDIMSKACLSSRYRSAADVE